MDDLLTRLKGARAPSYQIERELGAGGMATHRKLLQDARLPRPPES